MRETIHEEKIGGLTIKVFPDETFGDSPAEWFGNELFLVGYHREFDVRNDAVVTGAQCRAILTGEYESAEERQSVKELKTRYHVYGLEAYIHSGVVLALAKEGNFPDRYWDVSTLGAVFVRRKEFPTATKARKAAQNLIRDWNDYLSGNVYGYSVEDENGDSVASCWGFYGDIEKSGLLEQAREEAKAHNTSEAIEKRKEEHKQATIKKARALLEPYGIKLKN